MDDVPAFRGTWRTLMGFFGILFGIVVFFFIVWLFGLFHGRVWLFPVFPVFPRSSIIVLFPGHSVRFPYFIEALPLGLY